MICTVIVRDFFDQPVFGGMLEVHAKWGLGIRLSDFDNSEVPPL